MDRVRGKKWHCSGSRRSEARGPPLAAAELIARNYTYYRLRVASQPMLSAHDDYEEQAVRSAHLQFTNLGVVMDPLNPDKQQEVVDSQ